MSNSVLIRIRSNYKHMISPHRHVRIEFMTNLSECLDVADARRPEDSGVDTKPVPHSHRQGPNLEGYTAYCTVWRPWRMMDRRAPRRVSSLRGTGCG